jgi:hypothetical protein
MMMVRETISGISFSLTKGGIDYRIEDGCQTETFDNNKQKICQMGIKFSRWATAIYR